MGLHHASSYPAAIAYSYLGLPWQIWCHKAGLLFDGGDGCEIPVSAGIQASAGQSRSLIQKLCCDLGSAERQRLQKVWVPIAIHNWDLSPNTGQGRLENGLISVWCGWWAS